MKHWTKCWMCMGSKCPRTSTLLEMPSSPFYYKMPFSLHFLYLYTKIDYCYFIGKKKDYSLKKQNKQSSNIK
jgi:hypothetical protein